ncbi:MAG: FAD-dependent monooxygenase, partial [Bdellovibrionota bacterium]
GLLYLEKNALHIWPRGNYMLIALPNFDGSFTCTLFLPNEGPLSFQSLKTPEQVHLFFKEQFSDIVPLMPKLTEEYFGNPTGHMYTVKSFPWNYKSTCLLLGDAAHGIVPFFGQGMNAGFEDCTVLDDFLVKALATQGPLDWEQIALGFANSRKPNTDAIADLAVENFVEMRDKTGSPQFLLEKEVERILQREFPRDYFSRYSMVSFSRIPYQIAYEAGLIQSEILRELCSGIKNVGELNLSRAANLISAKLSPWMRAKFPA